MFTQNQQKNSRRLLIAGLTVIFVAVSVVCAVFVGYIRKAGQRQLDASLHEVSFHVSTIVDNQCASIFRALEGFAAFLSEADPQDDALLLRMQRFSNEQGCLRMSLADSEGRSRNTEGAAFDASGRAYLKRALQGSSSVSGSVESRADGSPVFLFTVPIAFSNGEKGALSAVYEAGAITEALRVESFGGKGDSMIVTAEGDVVCGSASFGETANLFDVLRNSDTEALRADFAARESGVFRYTLDGAARALSYRPLAQQDWYLVCAAPVSAVGADMDRIVKLAVAVNLSIVLLFVLLLLLTYRVWRKAQREIEHAAFYDPITGGMSAAAFNRAAKARISGAPAGSLFFVALDVNSFRLVNDLNGIEAGNGVLKYIYDRIHSRLQDGELAARVAADNYYIILRAGSDAEVRMRLEEMAADINRNKNETRCGGFVLQFKAGIYRIDNPSLDVISIQDRANTARSNTGSAQHRELYVHASVYAVASHSQILREKQISDNLPTALENGQFVMYLQPKLSLRTNRVAGAEALVRWQNPSHGLIPPGQFIPIAEKSGFVTQIDLFVFEEVCRFLARRLEKGESVYPISVNLSRINFYTPDFLESNLAIAAKYGIQPELLEFEITESMATESTDKFLAVVEAIHRRGFRCSIDDFGSQYSSLNLLKRLPADVLKLDKTFFDDFDQDGFRGFEVVEGIISIAHNIEMSVVAEGIESREILNLLRQMNCDAVQGYIVARPMAVRQFEQFLSESEAKF